MVHTERSYIYGTEVRNIEYHLPEEKSRASDKSGKKSCVVYKSKLRAIITVLVLFVMLFTVISRYTYITDFNYKIKQSEKTLNNLLNENSRLAVEIEKQTDIENIREVAENKLEMQKPDKYQMVYMNVPKHDMTITAVRSPESAKESGSTGSMIAVLFEKVSGFIRLLY